MLVKDIIIQQADSIECSQCGNCCPSYCKAKSGNLCLIHPSVEGSEKKYRGANCAEGPVFFALMMGVACPPVLKRIQELTKGDTFKTTKHPVNEVDFIENYGPFVKPRTLPSCESDFWKSMHKEI